MHIMKYKLMVNNKIFTFKRIWSLAATSVHFFLDEETNQRNQAAKKAKLRM